MDIMLFVKIIIWIVAIGATILTIFSIALMHHYTTPAGKLEVAKMAFKGVKPVFNWAPLLFAVVAWVAIFSFR